MARVCRSEGRSKEEAGRRRWKLAVKAGLLTSECSNNAPITSVSMRSYCFFNFSQVQFADALHSWTWWAVRCLIFCTCVFFPSCRPPKKTKTLPKNGKTGRKTLLVLLCLVFSNYLKPISPTWDLRFWRFQFLLSGVAERRSSGTKFGKRHGGKPMLRATPRTSARCGASRASFCEKKRSKKKEGAMSSGEVVCFVF